VIEGDGKVAAKKTKKHVSMSFDHEGEVPDDDDDPGKSLAKKAKKLVGHLVLVLVHLNCQLQVKFHCQVDLFPQWHH